MSEAQRGCDGDSQRGRDNAVFAGRPVQVKEAKYLELATGNGYKCG